MKVNEGSLRVDFNDDVEGLTRQVLSVFNPSSFLVEKKLANIFARSGKNRVSGTVPIDWIQDESVNWRSSLLVNIEFERLMNQILTTISQYQNYNTKVAMIIFFMSIGMHVKFKTSFGLDTEVEMESIDPEYYESLMADNANINVNMARFIDDVNSKISTIQLEFLVEVRTRYGEKVYEKALNYDINLYFGDISNLQRAFYALFEDEKLYFEFNQDLIAYRSVIGRWFQPEVSELQEYFEMAPTTYKRNKNAGLKLLINTFGIDLTREVIK